MSRLTRRLQNNSCCLRCSPTGSCQCHRSVTVSPAPPSRFQSAVPGAGESHGTDSSAGPGLGASHARGSVWPVPSAPCSPELTSAAHLAELRSPGQDRGKGSLSVGVSGPAWTAYPSSQAKISGETQPSGPLVREASSGLDFQIPESSRLGPILCLTSLQGPLMNR